MLVRMVLVQAMYVFMSMTAAAIPGISLVRIFMVKLLMVLLV